MASLLPLLGVMIRVKSRPEALASRDAKMNRSADPGG